MLNLKLYELPEQYEALSLALELSGGELTEEIEALMDALDDNLQEKVEAICQLISINNAQAKAVQVEEERLKALRIRRQNTAAHLKEYLERNLIACGKTRVETPLFVARLQKNSRPSIQWTGNECWDGLPECYLRTIPAEVALDKERIYEAWKRGEDLSIYEDLAITEGIHLRIQ